MKLADGGRQKGRPPDTYAMSMFIAFQKYGHVEMNEMRTYQVRQVLRAGTAIPLYCQKDARVHHMFHNMSVDCKLAIETVNGTNYFQKIL